MRRARQRARSPARETRIHDEIIVDAYGGSEQALGWYYHLEREIQFPFTARCIAERATSRLEKADEVTVVAMAPESECAHEMFVCIRWRRRSLAVPLRQLRAVGVRADTRQAIDDWHYWVDRGYEF